MRSNLRLFKKSAAALTVASGMLLAQTSAFGAATLTIQPNGSGGAVATLSGSINKAGLTFQQTNGYINQFAPVNQMITLGVNPSNAFASLTNEFFRGISGGSSWGFGVGVLSASSGAEFTLYRNTMMLPAAYQSGTAISSSATYTSGLNLTAGTYTYTWGTGANADSLTVVIIGSASAPTVASVSPNTGSTVGGTVITITGTDLTGATAITVGGNACTNVTVASATSATCTTPAGTAGTASVLVTTSGGTNAANTLFTYVVPVAAPIPTLGEWAMIFLASLMGMFAFARMRKHNR